MNSFSPTDLKTILHSKRANIYFLEYCRLLVNGGRVEYVTDEGKQSLYWNIPIANTTVVMLGNGTSITQSAMRELSKAGVMVGFCGGGGTPLYSGCDGDVDFVWFSPQAEYRPTEYLQNWFRLWENAEKRLQGAKILQIKRAEFINKTWSKGKKLFGENFNPNLELLAEISSHFTVEVMSSQNNTELFSAEAHFTKNLYKLACKTLGYSFFTRVKKGKGIDPTNRNLDYGNYLAYGLGATATWVLGLPHGLSLLHGKTRRGGLVFDVADLIKDALVLPQAFIAAIDGSEEQSFRMSCIDNFIKMEALDFMIDTLKEIAYPAGCLPCE